MYFFEAHFFNLDTCEFVNYSDGFTNDDYTFHTAYNKFFDCLFSKFNFPIQSLTFKFSFKESVSK